jgi:hypothetical protein
MNRKFKFPLKSSSSGEFPVSPNSESAVSPVENETISPKTPVSDTVPTEPQSISGVLTDEPASSEAITHQEEAVHHRTATADDNLPEVSADGPLPIDDASPEEVEDSKTAPEVQAATTTSNQNGEADIEIPNLSVSESTPIAISSATKSPETTNGHVASSIDEAIADFQTAIKTPEPESVKAPETLSATEIDETSAPVESSDTVTPVDEVKDKASPISKSTEPSEKDKVNGKEELSATAPRSVSASPAPPVKQLEDDQDDQGEGATMEEIDID